MHCHVMYMEKPDSAEQLRPSCVVEANPPSRYAWLDGNKAQKVCLKSKLSP